jgi:uncharacterized membrane protein YkvA (DUF1232 family)
VKLDLSRRIMTLGWREKAALLWRLFRDPDVPPAARALLPLLVVYIVVPFDIVPDDVPLLGQLDDVLIVAVGLTAFVLLTPRAVIEDHLRALE